MKMKAAVVTQNSDGNVEIVEREIRPLEHGEALEVGGQAVLGRQR